MTVYILYGLHSNTFDHSRMEIIPDLGVDMNTTQD